MIPYGRHDIQQSDIESVLSVLKSDYLTQGETVPLFENKVASYCGALHAVAVNSATSALHLACLALGLKENDYVWTSPISFVASANCALFCRAKIDFVDINPENYNLCPYELEKKLYQAEKNGTLPKIVIPVHLCGQSCDMEAIWKLSKQFGFHIIEDASHAIGGRYKDKAVGSCQYSDITVFSFHPVKIITTAEGGIAVTNNSKLAETMMLLRSHGITRDPNQMTHIPDGDWYYQQQELGFNYRMTEIQAALGVSQMERLDQYIQRRHEIAHYYKQNLSHLPITTQLQSPNIKSSYHLYTINTKNRKEIFDRLRKSGIGVQVHYIPIHLQPYYQRLGFSKGDFPHAESYYTQAMSLPIYPNLTRTQQDYIISTLEKGLQS